MHSRNIPQPGQQGFQRSATPGVPSGRLAAQITIRMSGEQNDYLNLRSEQEGRSIGEILREMLSNFMRTHPLKKQGAA